MHDRTAPCRSGLSSVPRRVELDPEIARQLRPSAPSNGCSSSRSRWPDTRPRWPRSPSSRPCALKFAAVGRQQHVVEDALVPRTVTWIGRAAATRTRWRVVSPSAPRPSARSTAPAPATGHRPRAAARARCRWRTRPVAMPRPSPSAASSGASASSAMRWKVTRRAPTARPAPAPPWCRRGSDRRGRRERRRPARASAPDASTGVRVRCASPSWMPRAPTPPSRPRRRAPGAPASGDVQLGAGDAGHRARRESATPGTAASGSLSSATSTLSSWLPSPTRPRTSSAAAALARHVQALDLGVAAGQRDVDRPDEEVSPSTLWPSRRGRCRSAVGASSGPCASADSDAPLDAAPGAAPPGQVARLELQLDHRRAQHAAGLDVGSCTVPLASRCPSKAAPASFRAARRRRARARRARPGGAPAAARRPGRRPPVGAGRGCASGPVARASRRASLASGGSPRSLQQARPDRRRRPRAPRRRPGGQVDRPATVASRPGTRPSARGPRAPARASARPCNRTVGGSGRPCARASRSSMSPRRSRLLRQIAARLDAARQPAGPQRAHAGGQVAVRAQVVEGQRRAQLQVFDVQLRVDDSLPPPGAPSWKRLTSTRPGAGVERQSRSRLLGAVFVEARRRARGSRPRP